MNWNDLDGSILFNKVFSNPIKIGDIDIFNITIDRDATTVMVYFDLVNELPDNPPPKWGKNFNRCRCSIDCSDISFLKIEGIATEMPAQIEINKSSPHDYEVIIKGDNIFLHIICSFVHLAGPSVYTVEE